MQFLDPEIHFDADKPFYSLVIGYLSQVHGLIDLVQRGMVYQTLSLPQDYIDDRIAEEEDPDVVRLLNNPPPNPPTQVNSLLGEDIQIDSNKLGEHLFSSAGMGGIIHHIRMSAGSLLVSAKELTTIDDCTQPLWQFFRHCRNAAAHGNKITLYKNEPKHPASWRRITIDRSMDGKPLFPTPNDVGLLNVGDVIYLLSDVEQKYPTLRSVAGP